MMKRGYLKTAVGIVGGIVLAATPVLAAGKGKGGGGESMAGGLPALEDRVDCLDASNQAATSWAVVDGRAATIAVGSSGPAVRSSNTPGVVTVEHVATGVYEVTFGTKDVSGCAYEATIGDFGVTVPAQGEISVSGDTDSDTKSDVFVQTDVPAGTAADASFHLVVHCAVAACL